MKSNTIVANGSVGGALAYLLAIVPTDWLGLLPPIPEAHFPLVVGALAVVISAALIRVLGKRSTTTMRGRTSQEEQALQESIIKEYVKEHEDSP